ncbi:MAG: acyl-CoA/acyl-ACP dehydrogenase [Burkholderiaceae bacterium]|jgi:alkylation response protein AidB-like acyl-CoA dehydrogenase|nr:acyl-CoA/acyl-ACP dehydrogenase [Burkholderiaceae bacterium]
MIDFTLDDALELAVDTARRFATERLAPMQREFEAARALPDALHAQAREIGFDRVDWPEACGGAGLGAQARVRVLEELAAGCPGAALALQTMGSAAHALLAFGGEQALAGQLNALDIAGGARAALVFDARGALKSDAAGRISGRLPWLPADRIGLLAILDRQGLRLVREGVALAPVPGSGLCAAGASEVMLDNAPVSAQWRDPAAAALALAHARLHGAALLVGQMHAAADYARRYALERVAFGKPIAHHQALAFLIVDMHAAVEMARELLHEAAWRLEQGAAGACAACASAWIEAAESAPFIGGHAVQILGGPGFMRDYPVEKYLRELRALGLLLGGADAARDDAVGDVEAGAMPAYLAAAAAVAN